MVWLLKMVKAPLPPPTHICTHSLMRRLMKNSPGVTDFLKFDLVLFITKRSCWTLSNSLTHSRLNPTFTLSFYFCTCCSLSQKIPSPGKYPCFFLDQGKLPALHWCLWNSPWRCLMWCFLGSLIVSLWKNLHTVI